MRVHHCVMLLAAIAVVVLVGSPQNVGRLLLWSIENQLEPGHSFTAQVEVTEWSAGLFRHTTAEVTYINSDWWSVTIRDDGLERSVECWVKTDKGLWQRPSNLSQVTWLGKSPMATAEKARLDVFLKPFQEKWQESLAYSGTRFVDTNRCILLVADMGSRVDKYYFDTKDFILRRYEYTSSNMAQIVEWTNITEVASEMLLDEFEDTATNVSSDDELAIPVGAPIISIYELEKPQQNGDVVVPYDLEQQHALQEACNNGHQPWRLDPVQVALSFMLAEFPEIADEIGIEDLSLKDGIGPRAVVEVDCTGALKKVYLEQLVTQGTGGIWTVTGYNVKN